MKDGERVYEIQLDEHQAGSGRAFDKKRRCVEVDGVGLVVYYHDEKECEPGEIRKRLHGGSTTKCIVVAASPEEAISQLYQNDPSLHVGTKSKAVVIDMTVPILELPACPRLSQDKEGRFCCGEADPNFPEESLAGCVLDDYAPYDGDGGCPIHEFWKSGCDKKQTRTISALSYQSTTFTVSG